MLICRGKLFSIGLGFYDLFCAVPNCSGGVTCGGGGVAG